MSPENRNSALAALAIMLIFGFGAHYLPKAVLGAGDVSPWLGALIGALFVLAFFAVFWVRGRMRNNAKQDDDQA